MKIHEYQAKEILRRFGVADAAGPGHRRRRARRAAICDELGGRCVVKAQIHAGGRGKGGGVKLAELARRGARRAPARSSACSCVTPQTGPEGQEVRKVLIEEALDIDRELYVAITLDRAAGEAGRDGLGGRRHGHRRGGGAAIPKAILREAFDPHLGLLPFQARAVVDGLGPRGQDRAPGGDAARGAGHGLPRDRRLARRDQPADDHQVAAT